MIFTTASVTLLMFFALIIETDTRGTRVAKRFGSIIAIAYFSIVIYQAIEGSIVLNDAIVFSTLIGLILSICVLFGQLKRF